MSAIFIDYQVRPSTPIPCIQTPLDKASSRKLPDAPSALHFPGHSSTCMPGSLLIPRTNSRCNWCLLPPGTMSSSCNYTGLMTSETTSSTCSPRGMLPSGTTRFANIRDNMMAKDKHENIINKNQGDMALPKLS